MDNRKIMYEKITDILKGVYHPDINTDEEIRKQKLMDYVQLIENPDKVEATMKITMSIKDWTELRDQLAKAYPSWKLSSMITNLLGQARKVFYEEHVNDG